MIEHVDSFAKYFESVRKRTLNYIRTLPRDRMGWAPQDGEFTCADLIVHIAAAEKMFVGAAVEGRWKYLEYDCSQGDSLEALLAHLEAGHAQAMTQLRTMSDATLRVMRPTLDGPEVKAWHLLMALVEHEIHHRSQLAVYLTLMGVEPPQIFGLGVEDVIARATG